MKKLLIVSFAAFGVIGCATEGKIISGNPSAVIIQHDGSLAASTKLATQHCAQYGKDIRLVHTQGWIMSFDCIFR